MIFKGLVMMIVFYAFVVCAISLTKFYCRFNVPNYKTLDDKERSRMVDLVFPIVFIILFLLAAWYFVPLWDSYCGTPGGWFKAALCS